MAGSLVAFVGAMGSGKSEKLIEFYQKFTDGGLSVGVFKPSLDTRDGVDTIRSRSGKEVEAVRISSLDELLHHENEEEPFDVVLIDEIQFFTQQNVVAALTSLTLVDIDVFVFGLDVTSDDTTFGMIGDILAHADEVIKLKSKCVRCGGEARVSFFKGDNKDSDIKVGDLDEYEPLCRDCFYIDEVGVDYLDIAGLGEEEEEKLFIFTFKGEDFHIDLTVTEKDLEDVGYTQEEVKDIVSLEGVRNLLEDLGYGVDLDE